MDPIKGIPSGQARTTGLANAAIRSDGRVHAEGAFRQGQLQQPEYVVSLRSATPAEATGTYSLEDILRGTKGRDIQQSSPSDVAADTAAAEGKLSPLQAALLSGAPIRFNIELTFREDETAAAPSVAAAVKPGQDVIIAGNRSLIAAYGGAAGPGSDLIVAGNHSSITIAGQGADNGNDTIIAGNHSSVVINGTGDDNGDDTVILGNHSSVVINGSGADNGDDTIILGNNSRLIFNGGNSSGGTGMTLVIGNNETVVLNGGDGDQANVTLPGHRTTATLVTDNGAAESAIAAGRTATITIRISMNDPARAKDLLSGLPQRLEEEIRKLRSWIEENQPSAKPVVSAADAAVARSTDRQRQVQEEMSGSSRSDWYAWLAEIQTLRRLQQFAVYQLLGAQITEARRIVQEAKASGNADALPAAVIAAAEAAPPEGGEDHS